MKTIASKSAHQQRGAALLVAMVMIFMLSIMGVSAMRGSTLERRMASNSIQANTVFQASDSSTEIALNDNSNLQAAWMSATNEVNITTDMKRTSEMESSVVLKYVGDGAAAGRDLPVRLPVGRAGQRVQGLPDIGRCAEPDRLRVDGAHG